MANLFDRKNVVAFVFGLLMFTFFTSKGIIVYNEEILVVFTFFGFIFFVYQYFSTTLAESLDSRSLEASSSLQTFLDLKKKYTETAIFEQQKQLLLSDFIKTLSLFSVTEMNSIAERQNNYLTKSKPNLVKNKLRYLSTLVQLNEQKLNESLALSFLDGVLEKYVSSKNKLRAKLYTQAINQLKSL